MFQAETEPSPHNLRVFSIYWYGEPCRPENDDTSIQTFGILQNTLTKHIGQRFSHNSSNVIVESQTKIMVLVDDTTAVLVLSHPPPRPSSLSPKLPSRSGFVGVEVKLLWNRQRDHRRNIVPIRPTTCYVDFISYCYYDYYSCPTPLTHSPLTTDS